jgi:hypothetical protein
VAAGAPLQVGPLDGEAFVVLGQTATSVGKAEPQEPILSVAFDNGQATWYLSPAPPHGLDTLGESGLRQPPRQLVLIVRAWLLHAHRAGDAIWLPADPPPRRASSAIDLGRDRFLPAPSAGDRARRTQDHFQRGWVLGVVALALLAWTGWRWLRREGG